MVQIHSPRPFILFEIIKLERLAGLEPSAAFSLFSSRSRPYRKLRAAISRLRIVTLPKATGRMRLVL